MRRREQLLSFKAMRRYGESVLRRFYKPRYAGRMNGATVAASVGHAACGDTVTLFLRIDKEIIAAISYLACGCPALVACCEALCELVEGKDLDSAWEVTDEAVVAHLGGLPPQKVHCSAIAAVALHKAIWRYVFSDIEEERE